MFVYEDDELAKEKEKNESLKLGMCVYNKEKGFERVYQRGERE